MNTDTTVGRLAGTFSPEKVTHEKQSLDRPLVSVIIPAFNEAVLLRSTLTAVCSYLESVENPYRWELMVVNDGSSDKTGELADAFASSRDDVRVVHHHRNLGLGQALISGFRCSRGDYIIVLDADLSYSPDHVGQLLTRIQQSEAKVVVASPYAKGGKVSDVPWLRRLMSICANRVLSSMAGCGISTLTGMARVYDGRFIRALRLSSTGMEINVEIIYKSLLLRVPIDEIPAHLDWQRRLTAGDRGLSTSKLISHIWSTCCFGFLLRPYLFFFVPGISASMLAFYANTWIVISIHQQYGALGQYGGFFTRASIAAAQTYQVFPHTCLLGGISLMLAIQFIGLGILSLQNKHYFEDLFHVGGALYENKGRDDRVEG